MDDVCLLKCHHIATKEWPGRFKVVDLAARGDARGVLGPPSHSSQALAKVDDSDLSSHSAGTSGGCPRPQADIEQWEILKRV